MSERQEMATTCTCIYCGRPLHQPLGLDDWKADTGLVTCFDSPDRTHRRTRWGQDNGSTTEVDR